MDKNTIWYAVAGFSVGTFLGISFAISDIRDSLKIISGETPLIVEQQ